MKRIFKTFVVTAIALCMMCSFAQAISIEDMLIKHRQFLLDEGEGYTEYIIVNYGNDTNKVMSVSDEYHFEKDVYDTEYFKNNSADSFYPGFSDSDANIFIEEEADDFYRVIFWFGKLDQPEYRKKALESEFFTLEEGKTYEDNFSADSLCESFEEISKKELKLLDLADLDLYYSLPEKYEKK